jgi:hypothetical protein
MSAEETVRALLQSAAPLLRGALRDATVDALVEDFTLGFQRLLRQAYDVGYRAGLAQSAGASKSETQHEAPLREENAPDDDDLEPEDEPLVTSEAEPTLDPDDLESDVSASPGPPPVHWGADGEREALRSRRTRESASTRIFPHATVGTLLQRIHDFFGLERFEIDVVVCRKGDRSRRQLKKSVKLAKYAVGE